MLIVKIFKVAEMKMNNGSYFTIFTQFNFQLSPPPPYYEQKVACS